MPENLDFCGAHGTHQINGILIHTFISVQQTDCDREKCGDDNQCNFWCHAKSHPEHQNRRNGNGRNRLCDYHQRIKCSVDGQKTIHQCGTDKSQQDTDAKTVKCLLQGVSCMHQDQRHV